MTRLSIEDAQARVAQVFAAANVSEATAASVSGVAGVLTMADDARFVFAREPFTGVAVCFFTPGSGFTSTQASSDFTEVLAVLPVLAFLFGGVTWVAPRARRVVGAMSCATFRQAIHV